VVGGRDQPSRPSVHGLRGFAVRSVELLPLEAGALAPLLPLLVAAAVPLERGCAVCPVGVPPDCV
jgi:hypothetical protein